MRRFALLLALMILSGCSGVQEATLSVASIAETTVAPTTEETEATSPPDPIELLLDSLSLEEKVGQLFLARCPGESAIDDIQKYHLGGFILFGKDFEDQTPETISGIISAYQNSASVPMLIAVDEEGGSVCRVSSQPQFRSKRFSSLRKLFNTGGTDRILEEETEKCILLKSLGINVNMAPVCDIATDPNAFMYSRSLGQDAATTAQCIEKITELMKDQKVGSVLKHFPGYGNNKDTHTAVVKDDKSLAQLENADLLPFISGIEARCDAILISHTVITALDAKFPASLSPSVISFLRNDLHFNGIIITDDLAMKAITKAYPTDEAAVLAVLAGNDMLCASDFQEQYFAVLDAATSGRIQINQLNAAVYRILQWKFELGILDFKN